MLQTLSYIINIAPEGVPQVVKLSQNENGRTLSFTLIGDGTVNIPSGATVTISGTKPDGNVYSATGTLSGNVASFSEDTQMTAVSGIWDAKINITYNGETIATCKVVMAIDPDPVAPGSVPSSSQLNGLVAEAQQYATYAKYEAFGSPLVAATAAAMTDKTRVYVYTGTETGKTAGHWYYWNGSAWTDGGVYNSQGINTDTTLTLAGMAADAKAVGEDLGVLSERMEELDGYLYIDEDDWEIGGITFTTSGWTYGSNTKRIRPKEGVSYSLKQGDIIGLSDYTNAAFVVGVHRSNDTYGYTETRRSDYVCQTDGDYALVVFNYPTEQELTSKHELFKLVRIKELAKDNIEKIDVLYENAQDYNAFDVFSHLPFVFSGTHNGITFTFGKNQCAVSGTASADAFLNFYHDTAKLPDGVIPGHGYYILYTTSNTKIRLLLYFYDSNGTTITTRSQYLTGNRYVRIPSNAVGMTARIQVTANTTVNTTVSYHMISAKTNYELEQGLLGASFLGLDEYDYSNGTHNGITYTWDADHSRCHVAGTAASTSFRNIFYNVTSLPSGMNPGDKIGILFASSGDHTAAKLYFRLLDGTDVGTPSLTGSTIVTVPSNAVGMILRLYVYSPYTVDDYATKPLLFKIENRQVFPFKARKPLMVSFVDDDTDTDDLVDKFYQNCKHNGVVGAYAVVTKQYINGASTIENLLDIEADGFNMIPHCQEQKTYLLPTSQDYDPVLAFKNYAQCLRDFRTLGLINPQNLWLIPYGSGSEENAVMAKNLGFDMAFTTEGSVNNYLTMNDKYRLHRCGLSALADVTDDTSATATGSMAKCKARVDELVASETGGWLILMTHFNTWQSETWDSTLDENGYAIGYARFNELAQYVINSGCEVVSMAQGAAYMKPIIEKNFTMG